MPPKVYAGTQLILVGERGHKDKRFESSEYLLAPPGTIVAPRPKGEPATEENAMKAVKKMAKTLGGHMGKGPAGYAAFRSKRRAPRGPRRLRAAAEGAATNPWGEPGVAEALQAIARVQQANAAGATQQGWQNFANLDIPASAPVTGGVAPAGSDIQYAEGSGQFNNLLATLLSAAGITGDTNALNLGVMEALGRIDPRALGITDPAKFRELIAQGKGMPTLQGRQQAFNESLYGFQRAAPSRGNVAQTGVM
jgi:hypothetical protein